MIGEVSYGVVAYREAVHLPGLPRVHADPNWIAPREMSAELSDDQRLPFLRPGR